jgi:hypothetical protein
MLSNRHITCATAVTTLTWKHKNKKKKSQYDEATKIKLLGLRKEVS